MRLTSKLATGTLAVALATVAVGTLSGTAAQAQESSPGTKATLDGRAIDLSEGWQGADVCAVGTSGRTTCVDTDAMSARDARAASDCKKDWVCLWDKKNFKGRMLKFNDEYWHNLADWGFSNRAESARNHQNSWPNDHAYVATGRDGKGTQKKIPEGYKFGSLGNLNNRVSSIYG
ncbi:peptidase inhibitor family I36 protein [Streptomyces coerulescens]|uniref:Peptidase inhibitor family I36 protein n=1 Tax=Streptomyces coerulescens TaxID=29304 RepID=A0ABW0CQQ5_STRCD